MNQLFLILLGCFCSLSLFAQTDPDENCTGAVGDVKYSILDPSKFREVNGDCWVLMDGRNLPTGNTLREMGYANIPDARGVFLRSLDNRTTERLDVDREFGTSVGHYQDDEFKSHHHGNARDNVSWIGGGSTFTNVTTGGNNQSSALRGGNETRPKNIIVWTYIRID